MNIQLIEQKFVDGSYHRVNGLSRRGKVGKISHLNCIKQNVRNETIWTQWNFVHKKFTIPRPKIGELFRLKNRKKFPKVDCVYVVGYDSLLIFLIILISGIDRPV